MKEASVVASDGVSLVFSVCEADAPKAVIFFLHGLGLNGKTYLPLAVQLAKAGYVAVLPDMRGCGNSGGMPDDVAYIGRHREDVLQLIEVVRAAYPDLPMFFGAHSVGCSLLMQIPDAVLDGVSGVFLLAPVWTGYTDYVRKITGFDHFVHLTRHWRRAASDALSPLHPQPPSIRALPLGMMLGSWWPARFGRLATIQSEARPAAQSGNTKREGLRRFTYRHFASLRCTRLHRRLTAWRLPLMVLVGEKDEFVQPSAVLSMLHWVLHARVPRVLAELERADHATVIFRAGRPVVNWLDARLSLAGACR